MEPWRDRGHYVSTKGCPGYHPQLVGDPPGDLVIVSCETTFGETMSSIDRLEAIPPVIRSWKPTHEVFLRATIKDSLRDDSLDLKLAGLSGLSASIQTILSSLFMNPKIVGVTRNLDLMTAIFFLCLLAVYEIKFLRQRLRVGGHPDF
jgi:hypothetical protein